LPPCAVDRGSADPVGARFLRRHGAIANVGGEIVAPVAANDPRVLNAAHLKLSEAAALGIVVMRAAIQDVELMRLQQ
jgi:hypothetical protein